MKILLTLIVLFFLSSAVVADDISDFQIEGMSIGDSLLDYLSEKEIEKHTLNIYDYIGEKFYAVEFYNLESFRTYEYVQVALLRNDKNYKIYSIDGGILYDNKINDCYEKQNEIVIDLSIMFNNIEKFEQDISSHPADPSGKSTTYGWAFFFNNDDVISTTCTDWSENTQWTDNLKIGLMLKEFNDWIK